MKRKITIRLLHLVVVFVLFLLALNLLLLKRVSALTPPPTHRFSSSLLYSSPSPSFLALTAVSRHHHRLSSSTYYGGWWRVLDHRNNGSYRRSRLLVHNTVGVSSHFFIIQYYKARSRSHITIRDRGRPLCGMFELKSYSKSFLKQNINESTFDTRDYTNTYIYIRASRTRLFI